MAFGEELGKLSVKVEADTKGLKTGLAGAEKQVGGFSKSIMKHHKAIGMAMTAAGAAIVGIGVKSVMSFADMGDKVAKMAKKTGFSVEALSELGHAAELSGTSLDGIGKATKKMSKTIVDASEGMTTYVRAFDRIGLSSEYLMKLKPEEQFNAILMAIAAVEDPTIRAATAVDIFGRSGADLLPMLSEGAEGLADMRQEAHDLNKVFDEETAKAAEEFKDAMTRLKGSLSGVMMTIAQDVVPILTKFIGKVTGIVTKITDWAKEHPGLTKALTILIGVLGGLLLALGPLMIMLPGLGIAFHLALGPIGLITLAITALIAAGIALWRNWDEVLHFFKALWSEIKILFLRGVQSILESLSSFTRFIPGLNKVVNEAKENIANMIDAEQMDRDVLKLQGSLRRINDSFKETGGVVSDFEEQFKLDMERLAYDTKPVAESLDEVGERAISMAEAVRKSLDAVEKRVMEATGYGQMDIQLGGSPLMTGRLIEQRLGRRLTRAERAVYGIVGYQQGGIVPGPIGQPQLAMVHGGETITPAGGGGDTNLYFTQPVFFDREESMNKFVDMISKTLDRKYRLRFGGAYGG